MSESKNGDRRYGPRTQKNASPKHGKPSHRVAGDTLETRVPLLRAVAANIVERRKANNMTQLHLAAKAGLGMGSMHQIENAITNSTLLTLQKIAVAFGCNTRDLLPEADNCELEAFHVDIETIEIE